MIDTEIKISTIDKNNFKARGIKLYQNNNTMKDLANFMEYPPNKEFFDKYFSSKENIICMNTFIKMYRHIETNDPYEKLSIIHDCINDPKIRRRLFSTKSTKTEIDYKPNNKTEIDYKTNNKTNNKTEVDYKPNNKTEVDYKPNTEGIKYINAIEYKKNV